MHSVLPNTDAPEYQFQIHKGGGRVYCASSAGSSVIRIDRSQEAAVPKGARLLDSFLEEFIARPEIAVHAGDARKALADDEFQGTGKVTLKILRLQKGLSQKELSAQIGTSQAAVSEYEARLRKPTEDMIRNLAKSLGTDFNTLMDALANG